MALVGLTCPDCGSSNVVDDDLYTQPQMVCVDCGSVVSEGALTTDRAEGTDVSYKQTTAVAKNPCLNQIKGLQHVQALCRILRLNNEVEELAQTYFKQAYEHRNFIRVRLLKKEALVGCCVLASCRLRNWPITMGTISCLLDADPMLMGVVYQDMVKTLNIDATNPSITDILATHSQEYKVGSLDVSEELAENSKDLTKRAVALVELAADFWIVTGRKPLPIMMASIYLAWQSLKPIKVRLKYTLEKFCQLAKVTKSNAALKRVAEIKEVLCKLGQEIPWMMAEVTPGNVMQQVEDILKHRFALLRRALRTHEDALLVELQPSLENTLPGTQSEVASLEWTTPSQISGPVEETPNKSCVEACEPDTESSQQPAGGHLNSCTMPELHNGTVTQGSQAPPPYWGKRVLLAPPCVRHPKIRRRGEVPVFKEVNGDEDISDSEIDMYIRTPQEVRDFVLAKKELCLFDNEQSQED